jgi:hypothetical protein
METTEKKRGWKLRAAWAMSKYAVIVGVVIIAATGITRASETVADKAWQGYEAAYDAAIEKLTRVEVVHQIVSPEDMPVGDIIERVAAEEGIPAIILKSIAIQESGKYYRTDRIRFEPHLMSRVKPPAHLNDIEKQLYASSIGLMQIIYGFHKERCGFNSVTDAFDPYTSVRCACAILKANLAAAPKEMRSPGARLRYAIKRYNGDGERAEAYTEQVMARLADLLLEKVEL